MRDEFMSLLQKNKAFGQALFGPIVQPIIQGFLELKTPKLLSGSFKVSLDWSRKFMKTKLGWLLKATTIAIAKLPSHWKYQRIEMVHRVAYLVKTYNVLTSLMINTY